MNEFTRFEDIEKEMKIIRNQVSRVSGLRISAFSILKYVKDNEENLLTSLNVSKALNITPTTCSSNLKELLAQKFIAIDHDELDRRRINITSTEAGQKVLEEYDLQIREVINRGFEQVNLLSRSEGKTYKN